MPVQTRAGGKAPPVAPNEEPKTYKPAPPKLQQRRFPQITKTYGRRRPNKTPSYIQETLTQNKNFFSRAPAEFVGLEDDEDEMEVDNDVNEEEKAACVVPAKKRSRQKATRGGNRRKTMGDDEEEHHEKPRDKKRRKTMGDTPSASSSFHTQTLTQLKFPGKKYEDEDWNILDSEEEEPSGPVQKDLKRGEKLAKEIIDAGHMDLAPGPSNKENEEHDEKRIKDSEDEEDIDLIQETPRREDKFGNPSNSQLQKMATPSNRRTKDEIPSSQSPATPMLLKYPVKQDSPLKHVSTSTTVLDPEMTTPSHQRTKLDIPPVQSPTMDQLLKYSPANQVSPSKRVSTNNTAPAPTLAGILKTPTRNNKKLEIEDSYSTSHSLSATPTPKANARTSTPTKHIRFDLPANKENITPGRTKPKSPKAPLAKTKREPLNILKEVIPDSDEDFGETTDEDDEKEEGGVAQVEQTTELEQITILEDEDEDEDTIMPTDDDESEAPYAIGEETQAILISSGDQSSRDLGAHGSSDKSNENSRDETPHGTQLATEKLIVTAETTEDVVEQTPVSSPHKSLSQSQAMAADPYTQGLTQGLESQRVPLEVINASGPVTDRSDIIISLYGEHVKKIVDRSKTHEFRAWKMPPTVHRVWIYITKPVSTLKYMCIFGHPAQPGEIDENGIGNKDFNKGKKRCASFAYEVLQMYELNNPVPLETMKRNGWPSAPQKYAYVPPAIVGQLTGNLRCALFGNEAEHEDLVMSSPRVTESQELEQQIRSDIAHSTQLVASDYSDEIIPSSQSTPKAKKSTSKATPISDPFARPALPRSLSGSSSRTLPAPMSQRSQRSQRNSSFYVRPSQATTVSQVSSSSPVQSPDRPVSLPRISSSQAPPIQIANSSSPSSYRTRTHSHSLRSSQFPTKSQMLPDSLLNDDVPEPPPIVFDSADEDSD